MIKFANLPCILLTSLLIKILITNSNVSEAIALTALTGLYGWFLYMEFQKQPDLNEVFKKEQIKVREELETIKAALASQKLGMFVRK